MAAGQRSGVRRLQKGGAPGDGRRMFFKRSFSGGMSDAGGGRKLWEGCDGKERVNSELA